MEEWEALFRAGSFLFLPKTADKTRLVINISHKDGKIARASLPPVSPKEGEIERASFSPFSHQRRRDRTRLIPPKPQGKKDRTRLIPLKPQGKRDRTRLIPPKPQGEKGTERASFLPNLRVYLGCNRGV